MTTLITSIIASNNSLATIQQQYKTSVAARQSAYRGTATSIEKILSPLKGAVEAQFGKTSTESKSIGALVKSMRSTKLVKLPADPTKGTQEKTISQSERSYGSMIQSFNNLVSSLQQFTGYNPSNTNLKIATLQAAATQITTLNNTVAQRIQTLKTTQTTRYTQYTDLQDRVQRIKAYVKSQYGVASTEYNLVKGIKV